MNRKLMFFSKGEESRGGGGGRRDKILTPGGKSPRGATDSGSTKDQMRRVSNPPKFTIFLTFLPFYTNGS